MFIDFDHFSSSVLGSSPPRGTYSPSPVPKQRGFTDTSCVLSDLSESEPRFTHGSSMHATISAGNPKRVSPMDRPHARKTRTLPGFFEPLVASIGNRSSREASLQGIAGVEHTGSSREAKTPNPVTFMMANKNEQGNSSYFPQIILKASLRLLFFRSVLASSFVCAAYSIWALLSLSFDRTVVAAVVFTIFTFAHHIVNALGPTVRLPVWFDLFITLCEIGFYTFVLTLPRVWHYTVQSRWFPKRAVVALLCAWLLSIALVVLFILKLLHIIDAKGKSKALTDPVDISKSTLDPDGLDYKNTSVGTYFLKSLFGRKVWEERIPGEGPWIVALRGVLSFMIIITVVVFGFYQIALLPISEMGMMPNKEFRSSAIPSTFTSSTPLAWNLIVVWQRRPGAGKTLLDVATVKPIWDTNSSEPFEGPPCQVILDPFGSHVESLDVFSDPWARKPREAIPDSYDLVAFQCPPRFEPLNVHSFQEYQDRQSDTRPDLELTVNFTELITPGRGLGTNGNTIRDSVQVYLGLTNTTLDTLSATKPTPLFPGMNVLSVASLIVRQRLEPPEMSSLGFDIQKTFMIAELTYLSANPFATTAQPNISVMRITAEAPDLTEWRIIQDFRNKSVLNGLSAVGGLGSLFNACFSILLGTSLLRAIFRTRPYGVLGIVHRLDGRRESIHEQCEKDYPMLENEIKAAKDTKSCGKRGVIALILDTLIDIEVLREHQPKLENSSGETDIEDGQRVQELNGKVGGRESVMKVDSPTTAVTPEDGCHVPNQPPT